MRIGAGMSAEPTASPSAGVNVEVVSGDDWADATTASWCRVNGATEVAADWDALDIDYATLVGAAELDGVAWLIEVIDHRARTAGAYRTVEDARKGGEQ